MIDYESFSKKIFKLITLDRVRTKYILLQRLAKDFNKTIIQVFTDYNNYSVGEWLKELSGVQTLYNAAKENKFID